MNYLYMLGVTYSFQQLLKMRSWSCCSTVISPVSVRVLPVRTRTGQARGRARRRLDTVSASATVVAVVDRYV